MKNKHLLMLLPGQSLAQIKASIGVYFSWMIWAKIKLPAVLLSE